MCGHYNVIASKLNIIHLNIILIFTYVRNHSPNTPGNQMAVQKLESFMNTFCGKEFSELMHEKPFTFIIPFVCYLFARMFVMSFVYIPRI